MWQTILEYISTHYAIEALIITIWGGIWTYFKTTDLWKEKLGLKEKVVANIIQDSVVKTYHNYVEETKENSENEKLNLTQKRHARNLAKEEAINKAKKQNIDLIKELGDDRVNSMIEDSVHKNRKREIVRRGGRVIKWTK